MHRLIAFCTAAALLTVPPVAAGVTTCAGDCATKGAVTIDDVIVLVRIALGEATTTDCVAGDVDDNGAITIDEIIDAVINALTGCAASTLPLHAAVHFDRAREPINQGLIGSDTTSPLPDVNRLLHDRLSPFRMRIDVGFEESGCPDGSVSGPLYDAASNSFNYCRLDQRLMLTEDAGATPLLIIDYTPLALVSADCANTNGTGLGAQHCPPADPIKYGDLVQAMITHAYGMFGVTDFEVWNEPDGFFFTGTLQDYLDLYVVCSGALVRAEQQLTLAPGTFHLGGPASSLPRRTWIAALLNAAVQDVALRVDFVSWHRYASNPFLQLDPQLNAGVYADDTAAVRGWIDPYLAQRTDLHPLLWIDEWNVKAFFDTRMDTAYGATFVTAVLHSMQDAGVDRAARFFTWDTGPASSGLMGNWGLFTNDGHVRPAFFSVAMWHQMSPTRVAVELLDPDSQQRDASAQTRYTQNVLASIDNATQQATILLYNFVAYDPTLAMSPYCGGGRDAVATLDLDGLSDGTYHVLQQSLDCTTPIQPIGTAAIHTTNTVLVVTNHSAQVAIEAPPDSTVLVTLAPAV